MPLENLSRAEKMIACAAVSVAIGSAFVLSVLKATSTTKPDPWSRELDVVIRNRDAVPACLNCLYPQDGRPWFCPNCAFPSGEYVTLMPYLQNFAIGEVFRRGVSGGWEGSIWRTALLVLASIGEYGFFAPSYWFWMIRKARGKPICSAQRAEIVIVYKI